MMDSYLVCWESQVWHIRSGPKSIELWALAAMFEQKDTSASSLMAF